MGKSDRKDVFIVVLVKYCSRSSSFTDIYHVKLREDHELPHRVGVGSRVALGRRGPWGHKGIIGELMGGQREHRGSTRERIGEGGCCS